jgi:hypothetical protein
MIRMLDLYLSVEAHDFENDLHYIVRIKTPMGTLLSCPPLLNQEIRRHIDDIVEVYKKNMVQKKLHLKLVK